MSSCSSSRTTCRSFKEEREERIQRLTELMANVEATPSEKFRRLVEAYQIEMEYGRTMSAYRQTLADGRDAEMVRLGRIALMYRVIETGETGYWDRDAKQFVEDPDSAGEIEEALAHRERGAGSGPHHRAGPGTARRPLVSAVSRTLRRGLVSALLCASVVTGAVSFAQQPQPPAQPGPAGPPGGNQRRHRHRPRRRRP